MIVAVRDESNNFLGTIGVGRDITDRLRTEEETRRRQAELTQVTRAAAIGALTAGLAHELRQPLTAVLNYARGCARRLRRSSPATDEVLGVLHRVVVEAERASTILDTLRAFVGKRRPSLDPAELNTLVREAVELIAHELRDERVAVDFQLEPFLRPVLADAVQIQQVILNLLRNAMEAMRDRPPDRRRLTLHTFEAGSDAAALAVRDTGVGFSEDVRRHLFEPLFTTKPDGLGLGLSISRSIIEQHGGRLWASSDPAGGAVFTFTLPIARESVSREA